MTYLENHPPKDGSVNKSLILISELAIAFSFVYAMNLANYSAITFGLLLFALFKISGSVSRGFLNLFLSIAFSAVVSSIASTLSFGFDTPFINFCIIFISCLTISILNRRSETHVSGPDASFQITLVVVLGVASFAFRQLTHLENNKLFAMLLPEDNAAWIHASSGFIRFDSSAGTVSAMDYGTRSFLSNFLSFLSIPTRIFSHENGTILSLLNVANAYSFLGLLAILASSSACYEIFQSRADNIREHLNLASYKYSLIGVTTACSIGNIFLGAGHLSLICTVAVVWMSVYMFTSNTSLDKPQEVFMTLWSYALQLLTIFALGTVWFPLIAVAFPLNIFTIFRMLRFGLQSRINISAVFHPKISLLCITSAAILLAGFIVIRVPNGYSVSNLINISSGGTIQANTITLSIALFGIAFTLHKTTHAELASILLSLIPICLLAFWVFSLSANPVSPGYSVEKFSLLVTLIGIPLFTGLVISSFDTKTTSLISRLVFPLLSVFALLNISWGINSFPRSAMLDRGNWSNNFLPMLLKEAASDKNAQLLCISPSLNSDMSAYTCSRFGSALQFREFSNDNLARRWRSQLLGGNLDPVNISEISDFLVPEHVDNFLKSGGNLTVILVPGPLRDVKNRTDADWVQRLPWDEITVIDK